MALKLPKIIDQRSVIKMLNQLNTNCPTGIRNYAIVMVLYRAGLRVQEVCDLALSDMNFETGCIYVQLGKEDKDRYVPMDEDIIKTCREWLKVRPESDYFFCTLKGGILDQRYVREVCYRISQKAGVYIQAGDKKKKVSPHKLRHSFATSALSDGTFNIRELQQLLGHENVATTQIYTHVVIDELQKKMLKRKGITG